MGCAAGREGEGRGGGAEDSRRRLVDQVNFRRCSQRENKRNTLDFSSGQMLDLLVNDALDAQRLDDVGVELGVHERLHDLLLQQLPHGALELRRHSLRLVPAAAASRNIQCKRRRQWRGARTTRASQARGRHRRLE